MFHFALSENMLDKVNINTYLKKVPYRELKKTFDIAVNKNLLSKEIATSYLKRC
jgi:hypothetical protein